VAPAGEVRIHHLNCGTLCPHGARLLQGEGGLLDRARLVCHCLAIESGDGIVLVDTGFGTEDVEHPHQLGRPFLALTSPRLRREDTALARLGELGFEAGDVRHIVVTHLDPDHSGGLPDFPEAQVHVFAAEYAAAMNPKLTERSRYIGAHWSHEPKWVTHATAGDEWQGFESVRVLPGSDPEVLLVPLIGHSRGHSGVAVRDGDGWMLHCGDSYFFRGEIETPPRCPPGMRIFQTLNQADGRARHENQERLRELARRGGDGLHLFCSHDPVQLERAQSAALSN
jgi:glyoxylase-like metal-dependent hydrolase (beta-lactamase superfamily II)